jgi:drug/metabolite transporter (DMT)-like permease
VSRRASVAAGLGLAILLDTIVQFTWKRAADTVPASAGASQTLLLIVHQPLFQLTLLLWICQFVNWMLVLGNADLSFAQPITALSYVTVALVGWLGLHEHIPPLRIAGIALIVIGVWQMSRTHHVAVGGAT